MRWKRIAERSEPDAEWHREACEREFRLDCPLEVFTRLGNLLGLLDRGTVPRPRALS